MVKGSDLLIAALENEGVDRIFGVPGEENLDVVESLRNSSIKLILTRHEQGAAFMAATYGRLTGKPGVCITTLGPGALNLTTGAAYALLGAMPMIMLTGQKGIKSSRQAKFQIVDVVSAFKPLTKLSLQIVSTSSIPTLVRDAFRIAMEERPGPVLLELPEDVAGEECDDIAMVPRHPIEVPVAHRASLDRAAEMILKAKQLHTALLEHYWGRTALSDEELSRTCSELSKLIVSIVAQATTFNFAFDAVRYSDYDTPERVAAFEKAVQLAQTYKEREALALCAINDVFLVDSAIDSVDEFLNLFAREITENPAASFSFLVVMEALSIAKGVVSFEESFGEELGTTSDWIPTPRQLEDLHKRAEELAVTEDEKRILAEETGVIDRPQAEPRFILEEARTVLFFNPKTLLKLVC